MVEGEPEALRHLTLDAITAATDVYVWQKLRRDMGLSRTVAERVVRHLILGGMHKEETDSVCSVAQLVRRRESAA